jgi:glycerate 2-kinase
MTEVAERHYLDDLGLAPGRLAGVAATRPGYARPTRIVDLIEAGHPVPDGQSVRAAERALMLASEAGADDLVLVLMSGGASANWVAPAAGLTLAEKQAVNRALLQSGATIADINTVRKHLSRIKGGRLAERAHPAQVMTLAISDVPGDDPAVIGSGPTVPDPSTVADARAVTARFNLNLGEPVRQALSDPRNESSKAGEPAFERTSFRIVARPADALAAAADAVRAEGYECLMLGDRIEGEARDVAAEHARLARGLCEQGRRAAILSGGELTVTVRGRGRGGPNQEYALALALALSGASGIAAVAADTDGTDGGSGGAEDPAGAFVDETTLTRARQRGLDPAAFLADNNSTPFFEQLGDLLRPGPTYTTVNDFRAILVDGH